MKTPCENTEFSFLLKRKLLISFLLSPSEKKRNSRLKLVKRVIFKNSKFWEKSEILGFGKFYKNY